MFSQRSSRMLRLGLIALAALFVMAGALVYLLFRESPGPPVLSPELGGDTTAFTTTRNAFGLPARNLDRLGNRTFAVGNSFFRQNWVTAPASTEARDGLGPTLNAVSCSSCHILDGRGKPPSGPEDPERGLLIRLSVPGTGPNGGPKPDPVYGGQLQDRGVLSVPPEGRFVITYEDVTGSFGDGGPYVLLRPHYHFEDLAFGPIHDQVMLSPRVAPAIIGMGLLEAIPAEAILALSDPEDADGNGISGRPNMVWNVREGRKTLGRFGWKANQPTVEQQTAGAFLGDIGITSVLFPENNCTTAQTRCLEAPNGGTPEISGRRLEKVSFYTQTLAVPAMRNVDDPQVRKGAGLFRQAGCGQCHTPQHSTGEHAIAALSNQTIFPYTDLLLHDMGPDLADGRPDFEADGQEWRTPPLWGIGLVETVNGHTRFLHDGRARDLAEAILWHGGEGQKSKDAFRLLSKQEREALLKFLESL